MARRRAADVPAARPELLALLAAVKAAPEDDAPRLILADWLDERGECERAEFLRAQTQAARLPEDDPRRRELEVRAKQLEDEYGISWLGPLYDNGVRRWDYERGLVQVDVSDRRLFGSRLNGLAESEWWAWVEGLRVRQLFYSAVDTLLSSPLLRSVAQIRLDCLGFSSLDERWNALLASPLLARVTHLVLDERFCTLLDKGCIALATSPHLRRLTVLHLWGNHVGPAGARALASSPRLRTLVSLNLEYNPIKDAGAAALAASPHLRNLTYLNLRFTGVTDDGVAALASARSLSRLTDLVLPAGLGGRAATALLRSRRLKHLRRLDADWGRIPAALRQALTQRFQTGAVPPPVARWPSRH
jgi:uncharacterized protein (TIGR02996 family)